MAAVQATVFDVLLLAVAVSPVGGLLLASVGSSLQAQDSNVPSTSVIAWYLRRPSIIRTPNVCG